MLNLFNGTKTLSCGCQLKHNHAFLNRGLELIQENHEIQLLKEIRAPSTSTCSHSTHHHRTLTRLRQLQPRHQRWYATNASTLPSMETGFEMATSSVRYAIE
jgi:hypothetical protein